MNIAAFANDERVITKVMPTFRDLTGFQEREVIGRPFLFFVSDQTLAARCLEEAEAAGWWMGELPLQLKSGGIVVVPMILTTLKAQASSSPSFMVLMGSVDSAAAKQESPLLLEELRELNQEMASLYRVTRTLSATRDLNTIYQIMFEQVVSQMLKVPHFVLARYDEETDLIHCEIAIVDGVREDPAKFTPFPLKDGPTSTAIRTGKSSIIDLDEVRPSMERSQRMIHVGDQRLTKSGMYVPLVSEQKIIGVMQIQSYERNAFTERDLTLLQTLAGHLTVALENARLFSELTAEHALLESRVEERTAELRRANEELAQAAVLKDEFLAGMSHELRTPLTAILGKAEILQDGIHGELNEKQLSSIRTMEDSSRHLLSLINDMLDLSKIEAGRFELEMVRVPVKSLCDDSLSIVKPLAEKKHLRITTGYDMDVAEITGDPRRLKQILVNFLSNAIKFTPDNGRIGLEILGDADAGVVHFTVWDTGIGISAKGQKRLFKPFVQLDSGLSRKLKGTGLGLSLVDGLAKLHGGSVTLESEPGKGSRFTFTLPWSAAGEVPEKAPTGRLDQRQPPADTAIPAGKMPVGDLADQPLILLAEDNRENRETMTEFLQAKGYGVVSALDGFEALDAAQHKTPELVLMDIQMPGMDGLEAIRQMRAVPTLVDVPIIALTALAMQGDKERCLAAGADQYMTKPVKLRDLHDLMQQLLAGNAQS